MDCLDSAKDSIPPEYELRISGTDTDKLGIWSKELIQCGSTFGPFIGAKVEICPSNDDFLVQKVVDEHNKILYYLDGSQADESNWLRHLKCAPKGVAPNVTYIQKNFQIFFRALKDISPGEELLIRRLFKTSLKKKSSVGTLKRVLPNDSITTNSPPKKKHAQKSKKSHIRSSTTTSNKHLSKKSAFKKYKSKSGKPLSKRAFSEQLDKKHHPPSRADGTKDHSDKVDNVALTAVQDVNSSIANSLSDEILMDENNEAKYSFKLRSYHIVKARQGKKLFKCDVCAKAYRYAFSLKRHFLRNHVNYKYLTTADLTNCNISLSQVDPHFGDMSIAFDSNPDHAVDSSNYRLPNLYHCKKCLVFFNTLDGLKTHFVDHNDNDKQPRRYPCTKCDMSFVMKQNLKRHLIVHSGEKRFKCQYCPKAFPTQANRKRHERIHEGVRPYSCGYCLSAFTQSGDLRKHIKNQHPDNFHLCNFCPKYFASEVLLRKHLAQHGKTLKSNKLHSPKKLKTKTGSTTAGSPAGSANRPGWIIKEEHEIVMESESPLNPRKKYLCSLCKQRFSTYISMCLHREEAHPPSKSGDKQSRPSSRSKVEATISKSPANKVVRAHSSETEFYMNIASKIADNLLNHVDGKFHQLHLKPPVSPEFANEHMTEFENVFKPVTSERSAYGKSLTSEPDSDNPDGYNSPSNLSNSNEENSDGLLDKKGGRYSFLGLNEYACTQYYSSYTIGSASDNDDDFAASPCSSGRNSESGESALGRSFPLSGEDAQVSETRHMTYICSTCTEAFYSLEAIEDHKINNHPNVFCTHIEIEGNKDVPKELLRQEYSPYGLLGQSMLPQIYANDKLNCTKCYKLFGNVSDLHLHILECGIHSDFRRQRKQRVRVSRKKGRPTKNMARLIMHHKNSPKIKGSPNDKNSKSKRDSKTLGDGDTSETTTSYFSSPKPTNPKKIVSCRFCGKMFKYMKSFERHLQGCSLRNRIAIPDLSHRVLAQGKSSELYKCKHCRQVFKGIVSLKQHLSGRGCRAKHKEKHFEGKKLKKPKLSFPSDSKDNNSEADCVVFDSEVDNIQASDLIEVKGEDGSNSSNNTADVLEQVDKKLPGKLLCGLQKSLSPKSGSTATLCLNKKTPPQAQSSVKAAQEPELSFTTTAVEKILTPSVCAIREKLSEKLNRGLKLAVAQASCSPLSQSNPSASNIDTATPVNTSDKKENTDIISKNDKTRDPTFDNILKSLDIKSKGIPIPKPNTVSEVNLMDDRESNDVLDDDPMVTPDTATNQPSEMIVNSSDVGDYAQILSKQADKPKKESQTPEGGSLRGPISSGSKNSASDLSEKEAMIIDGDDDSLDIALAQINSCNDKTQESKISTSLFPKSTNNDDKMISPRMTSPIHVSDDDKVNDASSVVSQILPDHMGKSSSSQACCRMQEEINEGLPLPSFQKDQDCNRFGNPTSELAAAKSSETEETCSHDLSFTADLPLASSAKEEENSTSSDITSEPVNKDECSEIPNRSEVIFEKEINNSDDIECEAIDISHIDVDCTNSSNLHDTVIEESGTQLSMNVQSLVQLVKMKLKRGKDVTDATVRVSGAAQTKPEPVSPDTNSQSPAMPSCNLTASQPEEIIRPATPKTEPNPLSPSKRSANTPSTPSVHTLYAITQQKHTCPTCLRTFAYLANYRKHLKEVCPVRRQQIEEENRKSGILKMAKESVSTVPLAGTSSLSSRGQIESSVIGLLRTQSHQQELMKNNCTSRFCKYECQVCHKIFFNFLLLMRHSMSHKLDHDGTVIKQEDKSDEIKGPYQSGTSSSDVENVNHFDAQTCK